MTTGRINQITTVGCLFDSVRSTLILTWPRGQCVCQGSNVAPVARVWLAWPSCPPCPSLPGPTPVGPGLLRGGPRAPWGGRGAPAGLGPQERRQGSHVSPGASPRPRGSAKHWRSRWNARRSPASIWRGCPTPNFI